MKAEVDTELHEKEIKEKKKSLPKGTAKSMSSRKETAPEQAKKTAKDIIAEWRKENPNGHKSELCSLGKVSRSSVNRYWDSCGEGDHPYSALEKIFLWRQDNPYGTKKECIEATGLSRRSIFALWDKQPEGEQPIKQVIEKQASVDMEQINKKEQKEEKAEIETSFQSEGKEPDKEKEEERSQENQRKQRKPKKKTETSTVEPDKKDEQETVLVGKHGQLFFDF